MTLYRNIQEWCASLDVTLPDMHLLEILMGIIPWKGTNAFVNTVLLIYKYVIFKYRDEGCPTLQMFKVHLNEIQSIEYKIAVRKDKLPFHLFKWGNYLKESTHAVDVNGSL